MFTRDSITEAHLSLLQVNRKVANLSVTTRRGQNQQSVALGETMC
jgi:hypothetical protein